MGKNEGKNLPSTLLHAAAFYFFFLISIHLLISGKTFHFPLTVLHITWAPKRSVFFFFYLALSAAKTNRCLLFYLISHFLRRVEVSVNK